MLHRIYDWMMAKAGHRHALAWLAAVAFIEASVFPIPPDVMLIPMVLAAPSRWFRVALVATLASVAGGYLGYAIGALAMNSFGMEILDVLHLRDAYFHIKPTIDKWGVWFIIIKGMTPIPYKLVTIASGLAGVPFALFMLYSAITRTLRFVVLEGLLVYWFGEQARIILEKYLEVALIAFLALVVLGFVLLNYILK